MAAAPVALWVWVWVRVWVGLRVTRNRVNRVSDLVVVGTAEVGETVEGFAVDGTGVLGSGVGATVVGGIELGVGVDGAAVHTAVLQAIVSAVAGHGSPVPSEGSSIARSRLELPPPPDARLRSEASKRGEGRSG